MCETNDVNTDGFCYSLPSVPNVLDTDVEYLGTSDVDVLDLLVKASRRTIDTLYQDGVDKCSW